MVCARPKIRQLFRLTGLDHRIPLARTLDEVPGGLGGEDRAIMSIRVTVGSTAS